MARYALNLPTKLKEEAERFAAEQGVSLNQFILWAVAERVGGLKERLEDPAYPQVTYRRSQYGPVPVVRGTGIHVQTVVMVAQRWGFSVADIAEEFDLSEDDVVGALAFYDGHRAEIDAAIAADEAAERQARQRAQP